MTSHPHDALPLPDGGKLIFTPCPGTRGIGLARAGMCWFHRPVEDGAAPGPAFEQAWAANRDALMSLVSRHRGIAIHCRGGSGRTGLMAALILREMGIDGARADTLVKGLRPKALTLPAHTNYLRVRDDQYALLEQ